MENTIHVVDLFKTYQSGTNRVEVLRNISLTIEQGEFVAIMGPSGSGKSTLLYLMGALDRPTSGQILIQDQDITRLRDRRVSLLRRRKIGFVFQFYNLVPDLSVEENILLPALLDGGKRRKLKDRVAFLLESTGLEKRRRHTPRELSGGEQQRVAIARALMNEPDIILADEPVGNLDSRTGTGILELLSKVNREHGKTIVMVTHSEDSARYTRRLIRIKDGQLAGEEFFKC
ncbi:MAG: ABC transporter ATP-binding protein [Thermoclostridium sp.]|nr:ABC transporter ATP-binding protein [Thermoclostridium sp.]